MGDCDGSVMVAAGDVVPVSLAAVVGIALSVGVRGFSPHEVRRKARIKVSIRILFIV
jgi:hypothetical protein